ncbi:hypothetical protein B0J13DRAFT_675252 [Dactylonectria estremocensis]|uniref:Uncharacterized protein n=1 Tax=Dactylonectria estremocensis TaxID=1079267 RepID=A0A9P9J6Z9_9HYPO|nr:hypothetical protein B0J13DRAFT_675252 [Dactylonectria estremocensis]
MKSKLTLPDSNSKLSVKTVELDLLTSVKQSAILMRIVYTEVPSVTRSATVPSPGHGAAMSAHTTQQPNSVQPGTSRGPVRDTAKPSTVPTLHRESVQMHRWKPRLKQDGDTDDVALRVDLPLGKKHVRDFYHVQPTLLQPRFDPRIENHQGFRGWDDEADEADDVPSGVVRWRIHRAVKSAAPAWCHLFVFIKGPRGVLSAFVGNSSLAYQEALYGDLMATRVFSEFDTVLTSSGCLSPFHDIEGIILARKEAAAKAWLPFHSP